MKQQLAVVVNGRKVLSNIIASQIDIHKLYGGVVPEIASRKHIEKINQVIDEALTEAGKTLMTWTQSASLMVPVWLELYWWVLVPAKAISYAKRMPLVGVHHIEGHISANYIANPELEPPFYVWWLPVDTVIW